MFDLPARFRQDEKLYALSMRTRAHFRYVEERELQARADATDLLNFSERREKMPLDPLDQGFIGFVSRGIYNDDGNLIGDTLTAKLAALGREKQPRIFDDPELEATKGLPGFNHTQQHAVVLQAGLEMLQRSTERPIVRSECETTRRMVASGEANSRPLSSKALRVLARTNYLADRSLSYNLHNDIWDTNRRQLRRRGLQAVATLLFVSLDRGDFDRAYTALGVLIRSEGIIMRNLWMPAVEVLVQRHAKGKRSPTSTAFLDWIIVNFPSLPQSIVAGTNVPRAEFFRPLAIMSRLMNKDYRGAMEKAEEAMLTIPSSADPLCWALAGLTALKIQEVTGVSNEKNIEKFFARCIELGGVVPRCITEFAQKRDATQSSDQSDLGSKVNSDSEAGSGANFESDDDLGLSPRFARNPSSSIHSPPPDKKSDIDSELNANPNPESDSESGTASELTSDHRPYSSSDSEDQKEEFIRPSKRIKLEKDPDADVNEIDTMSPVKQEAHNTHSSQTFKTEDLFASQKLQEPIQSQASTLGASWTDSESEDE